MKIVTATVALLLLACSTAQAAGDGKSTTGARCRPVYTTAYSPRAWEDLRFAATGVTNQNPTRSTYVSCGLPSDGADYLDGSLYIHVRAGGTAATVECSYAVDHPDYWSRAPKRTVSVPAFGSAVLAWEGIVPDYLDWVECKLPPHFRIGLIRRVEPVDTDA